MTIYQQGYSGMIIIKVILLIIIIIVVLHSHKVAAVDTGVKPFVYSDSLVA